MNLQFWMACTTPFMVFLGGGWYGNIRDVSFFKAYHMNEPETNHGTGGSGL
jgi:hypothetical protein